MSWLFDQHDLIQLTEYIARGGSFCTDGPRISLNDTFNAAWDRSEEKIFYKKIPRDELLAYIHCNKPITLTTARRLALRTGISLVDFLCGVSKSTTRELDPNWSERLPLALQPKKRRRLPNKSATLKHLQAAVQRNDRLSLSQVSKEIGVSTGGLFYIAPNLCNLLVQRHRELLQKEKEKKVESARKLIADSIKTYECNFNTLPGKKTLLKILYPSSGIPKHILRDNIEQAISQLANPAK
jgi:hypothetical protein